MTIEQIEEKLKQTIKNVTPQNFLANFLLAYGSTNAEIKRLEKGTLNASKILGETILKKKLFFKEVNTAALENILPAMASQKLIAKHKVRFILATDYTTLKAIDTKTNEVVTTPVKDLLQHLSFFLPLAGMEKYQTHTENEADVKVAVQMAKLFDEIKKINPTKTQEQVHNLNIFLSRLLFCFFAEDTNIFTPNLFTSSISNHTQTDGSDLQHYLQQLFVVLNTEKRNTKTPTYLTTFPYVNGGLFKANTPLPVFNTKIRQVIIECGGQNWASINPDIFGSMIQAVVTPDQRGNLGMHYTSVPNIMKVIQPLFLDELYDELTAAKGSTIALNKLLSRIANIRIFDPACGSGNFLIIAYKQLRLLEIKILTQLKTGNINNTVTTGFEDQQTRLFKKQQLTLADAKPVSHYQIELFSRVELNHFYGIELDDFAHEIAKLSLWLAQHQMNMEFDSLLGATTPSLPLSDAGQITQGNATRLSWETVCPKPKVGEVFILGNPPYIGTRRQSEIQTQDLKIVYGKEYKSVDYIAAWFYKGANYIRGCNAKAAFVSTNSICQGEQVGLIWPNILNENIEIDFAYKDFKWSNLAQAKAAVIVVIIGLRNRSNQIANLFIRNIKRELKNISPYLGEGKPIYIFSRAKPISEFPEMNFGNMPADGGKLLFTTIEKEEFIEKCPEAKHYFKKLLSADEFLNGSERWCLWLEDVELSDLKKIPMIWQIVNELKLIRENSSRPQLANIPHLFAQITQPKNQNYILFPSTTSERRKYIPLGFFSAETVAHNSCLIVATNATYLFSVFMSNMQMVWVNAVCGRLKTDYRYSKDIVYNNFPFPPITQAQKDILEQHTHNILKQRAQHTRKTLAELYDPNKMPEGLRLAHQANDLAIEKCYRDKPFESDEERLAYLFNLYEVMIAEEKTRGTLFAVEAKAKKSKKK